MVCTDDDTVAERIKVMRLHGIDREAWSRYREVGRPSYYEVVAPGYKYNLPDIAAAIGRVQLRRAQDLLDRRTEQARRYRFELEGYRGITFPAVDTEGHAHHLAIAILPDRRDELSVFLGERRIGTSVHYHPLHRMPYWHDRYGVDDADLPGTAAVADRIVSLPLYPDLTRNEQDRVIEAVRTFYG